MVSGLDVGGWDMRWKPGRMGCTVSLFLMWCDFLLFIFFTQRDVNFRDKTVSFRSAPAAALVAQLADLTTSTSRS